MGAIQVVGVILWRFIMSVDIRDLIAHAADTALMGPDTDKLEYACATAILSALADAGIEC